MRLEAPDFRLDVSRLREAVTGRTRMLMLNTPHNPTGAAPLHAPREDDLADGTGPVRAPVGLVVGLAEAPSVRAERDPERHGAELVDQVAREQALPEQEATGLHGLLRSPVAVVADDSYLGGSA